MKLKKDVSDVRVRTDSSEERRTKALDLSKTLDIEHRKQVFLNHLAVNGRIHQSCVESKMWTYAQLNRIRKVDLEFNAEIEEAIDNAKKVELENLEREIFRRAHEGYDRPVYQGGKQVGVERAYSDSLLMFRTKRLDHLYRDNASLIVPPSNPSDKPPVINIAIVTPEQSRALHEALRSVRNSRDDKIITSGDANKQSDTGTD